MRASASTTAAPSRSIARRNLLPASTYADSDSTRRSPSDARPFAKGTLGRLRLRLSDRDIPFESSFDVSHRMSEGFVTSSAASDSSIFSRRHPIDAASRSVSSCISFLASTRASSMASHREESASRRSASSTAAAPAVADSSSRALSNCSSLASSRSTGACVSDTCRRNASHSPAIRSPRSAIAARDAST